MSRPTIQCPHCSRELFNLRYPHCSWCGTELMEEEFQKVAKPPGSYSPPASNPMPILPPTVGMFRFGRAWQPFNASPFRLIKRSVSPWERKLRIVGAALFICLMLAHLLEAGYAMWRMHQLLPLH